MKRIMGILNATPDSFFEPSRYNMSILNSGADIVDIGAVSSRPGASPVSEEEEWKRLRPVLLAVDGNVPLSIDTTRSGIVRKAYKLLGRAFIVNDISCGEDSPDMLDTVRELSLKYVAMHHRCAPDTGSVIGFFEDFSRKAGKMGIDWILDPGFGFGKDRDENWRLLRNLGEFRRFGREILVGISRKRMTGGNPDVTEEAHLIALQGGADILRVHDVATARKTLDLYSSTMKTSSPGSAK